MNLPEQSNPNSVESNAPQEDPSVAWRSLTSIQRRVAGVLVEKSKTTPDVYPMTINGIKTAANQKSNRSPQMDLREDQVEETLYELRQMGAVIEVHSGGRVPKFKHQLYEWLGVEKVELAVMAELLLRGEQTLGDLRARAARMDKIAGINELRPILDQLIGKNLVVELTPSGRGQMVTHRLYLDNELAQLKKQYSNLNVEAAAEAHRPVLKHESESVPKRPAHQPAVDDRVDRLAAEVSELREKIDELQNQLAEIQELLK